MKGDTLLRKVKMSEDKKPHYYPKNLRFSFDLETTGLIHEMPDGQPYLTELAMVPIDIEKKTLDESRVLHMYLKTPDFAELEKMGKVSKFVKKDENLRNVCKKAAEEGISSEQARIAIEDYLKSFQIAPEKGVSSKKAMILSKSIAGLDRPMLCQYFGDQWVEEYFSHRMTDLSSCIGMIVDANLGILSSKSTGKVIEETIGGGKIPHTAREDAVILANVYLSLLQKLEDKLLN